MPHAQILSAFEGHPAGRILVANLSDDPAAGAEISLTIPGRSAWDIYAVFFSMVTDANVASRFANVTLDDGQNVFARVVSPLLQGASSTRSYTYYRGADVSTVSAEGIRAPLPEPLRMLPGWRIRTETQNLRAGDNYGAMTLYAQETPERGGAVWDDLARAVAREIIERRAFDA